MGNDFLFKLAKEKASANRSSLNDLVDGMENELRDQNSAARNKLQQGGAPGGLLSNPTAAQTGETGKKILGFYQKYGDLVASDLFLNWADLDGNDYRKIFGYEFILFDGDEIVLRMALPLNPQSIKIGMKHASNLQVTQRGIIEEHNGAPLRPISIAGTMGVFNTMAPSLEKKDDSKTKSGGNFFEKAFKGAFASTERALAKLDAIVHGTPNTKSSVGRFQKEVNQLSSHFTGGSIGPTGSDMAKFVPTGYTYMHMLERFFSYYMAAKKTKAGRNLRLVFAMHKDKMYYYSSFRDMNISKPPGSLEYHYNIQLVAWRRVDSLSGRTVRSQPNAKQKKDTNALQDILAGIKKGRKAIAAAKNVLVGLRSDIETFTDPIKEAGLLMGDITGLAADLVLLPRTIIKNAEANINAGIAAIQRGGRELGDAMIQAKNLNNVGNYSTLVRKNQSDSAVNPGTPSSVNGQSDPQDQDSPVNQLQRDNTTGDLPSGAEILTVDDILFSNAELESINQEIERVSKLNADHFRQAKINMGNYAADIAEQLGGGSETYNRANSRGQTVKKSSKLSLSDIQLLSELQQAMQNIDGLISYLDDAEDDQVNGYIDFYSDLAQQNDIAFEDSTSKKFVPFPTGFTLEQLAMQYLGDEQRWIEIAAVNGLKVPYIDEVGFKEMLLASGAGNSLVVAKSDNLYVGQKIEIRSEGLTPEIRKIKSIDVLSEVYSIIDVDGASDLSKFTISNNPYIKAFLPNTVNSNNMIAIPDDSPFSITNKISTSPGTEDINQTIQIAQTDFLLTSAGDLAMTSAGDVLLSFGLQNIIQAAVLKTRTAQGDILSYPSFGNPLRSGSAIGDLSSSDVLEALNSSFSSDPRFTNIPIARVRLDGAAMVVDMMLAVAGVNSFLPLTAEIPR